MQELINQVQMLANDEYNRAAEKHGTTHASMHEAYAVMLEEYEEAINEITGENGAHSLTGTKFYLDEFWLGCKENMSIEVMARTAKDIYFHTVQAAAELIQLAAMAHKTTLTGSSRDTAASRKKGEV